MTTSATEQREPHPLQAFVNEGEAQKKRLSHVEIKATKDLMSEVRQPTKRGSLKQIKPVAKQELLSAVRTEAGKAKKRLSQVEPRSVAGLMTELRSHGSSE